MTGRESAERIDVYDCSIDNLSFAEALDQLVSIAQGSRPSYVVTPNVDHLVMLKSDERLRLAYEHAALRLADGKPVVWAAKLLGTPLKGKVSGSDLLPALCERAQDHGLGVFFLGGRSGAGEKARASLLRKFPKLNVVGVSSPPMHFESNEGENELVIQQVCAAKPDILFVALGAPRQEIWLHETNSQLAVPLAMGIGASIDFVAGYQKRAPKWMQGIGLEWFYRLLQEPRRMAKRYLIRDAPFIGYLLKLFLKHGLLRLK